MTKVPTLYVTRGLPGSGKTTRARAWVAEDPQGRARVNRDDLRKMVDDGVYIPGVTEKRILEARDALIMSLLGRNLDVVNDDTNLPQRTVRDLAKLAAHAGAEFVVWDMTDVPVQTCVERDDERPVPVGAGVIMDMYDRFLRGKSCPLPLPEESTEEVTSLPVRHEEGLPWAIVCDIDGTVARMTDRSPFDETRVHEDEAVEAVIECVLAMTASAPEEYRHELIFMSGRTDACKDATRTWLEYNITGSRPYELHMRAKGDCRKDSLVKAELFDRHVRGRYNIRFVLDDRNQVVDMWRQLGLTCFQVAPGNF